MWQGKWLLREAALLTAHLRGQVGKYRNKDSLECGQNGVACGSQWKPLPSFEGEPVQRIDLKVKVWKYKCQSCWPRHLKQVDWLWPNVWGVTSSEDSGHQLSIQVIAWTWAEARREHGRDHAACSTACYERPVSEQRGLDCRPCRCCMDEVDELKVSDP